MESTGVIEMSKEDTITNPSGFTLVELMITLLISGVIILAIYSAHSTQNRVFIAQEAVAEMQQNIRTGLAVMSRDIRMAGYDLTAKANAGFVNGVNFSNGASSHPLSASRASRFTESVWAAGNFPKVSKSCWKGCSPGMVKR